MHLRSDVVLQPEVAEGRRTGAGGVKAEVPNVLSIPGPATAGQIMTEKRALGWKIPQILRNFTTFTVRWCWVEAGQSIFESPASQELSPFEELLVRRRCSAQVCSGQEFT